VLSDVNYIELRSLKPEALSIAQWAIESSGETFQPSPGQLMSHVHHRVARIVTDAVFAFLQEQCWTPPPPAKERLL
jgi:hypothetical protein